MRRKKKERVTNEQTPVQPNELSHGKYEPAIDPEARFKARADLGSREEGLRLLDKLDWAEPGMRQSILDGMNTPIEDCEILTGGVETSTRVKNNNKAISFEISSRFR